MSVKEEVIDLSKMTEAQAASLTDEEIAAIEMKNLKFLRRVKPNSTTVSTGGSGGSTPTAAISATINSAGSNNAKTKTADANATSTTIASAAETTSTIECSTVFKNVIAAVTPVSDTDTTQKGSNASSGGSAATTATTTVTTATTANATIMTTSTVKEPECDYVIIVDKSASMKTAVTAGRKDRSRWLEARDAVSFLAPEACRNDADGITLYFFSSSDSNYPNKKPFNKFKNVKTADEVMRLFDEPDNQPKFGTDMTSVLADAFSTRSKAKTTVILMITDGAPDNEKAVEQLVIATTHGMNSDDELGLSIIQVGNDQNAKEWLNELDNDLSNRGKKGAKFDIVDTMNADKFKSKGFAEIVSLALKD